MITVDKLIEHARQHRTDTPVAGDILTKGTLTAVLRDLLELQLGTLADNARSLAEGGQMVMSRNGTYSRPEVPTPDPRQDAVARSLAALISRVEDLPD